LPRRIVVDALRSQTGLEVEIQSLSVSWWGRTRAEGIAISLPLSNVPLVEVPRLEAEHASLHWILITGLDLAKVRIESPVVTAHRAEDDETWSLMRALSIIEQRQRTTDPAPPPLLIPEVRITDATLRLDDRGRRAELDLPAITVNPVGAGAAEWNIDLGDIGRVTGRGLVTGDMPHQLHLVLVDGKRLAGFTGLGLLEALRADLEWFGRVEQGRLMGKAKIGSLEHGEVRLEGQCLVEAGADGLKVDVAGLRGAMKGERPVDVALLGGRIMADPARVELVEVLAQTHGMIFGIDADVDPVTLQSTATIGWRTADESSSDRMEGSLELAVGRATEPGLRRVVAKLQSSGRLEQAEWDTRLELLAIGDLGKPWQWKVTDAQGWVSSDQVLGQVESVAASGRIVGLELVMEEALVAIRSQDRRGTIQARARAEVIPPNTDLDRNPGENAIVDWGAGLIVSDLYVPWLNQKLDRAVVELRGDTTQARFELVEAVMGEGVATLEGEIHLTDGMKLSATYNATHPAIHARLDEQVVLSMRQVKASGGLEGSLMPMDVELDGRVEGRFSSSLKPEYDQNITVPIHGGIKDQVVQIRTNPFDLFNGRVTQLEARHDLSAVESTAKLELQDIDLAEIDGLVTAPMGLTGRASADLTVQLKPTAAPEGVVDLVTMTEEARRAIWMDLSADGYWRVDGRALPQFETTRVGGKISLRDGRIELGQIEAQQPGDGRATGQITIELARLDEADIVLSLENWQFILEPPPGPAPAPGSAAAAEPVDSTAPRDRTPMDEGAMEWNVAALPVPAELPRVALKINGDTQFAARLGEGGIGSIKLHGPVGLEMEGVLGEASPLSVNIRGDLDGREFRTSELSGTLLGGRWFGTLTVPLDDPLDSRASIEFRELDGVAIDPLLPGLAGFGGRLSGRLTTQPATGRRDPAPYKIMLDVEPVDGSWRRVDMGNISLIVFHDGRRFLLDRLNAGLADGDVEIWGRAVPRDGVYFAYMNLRWERISIPQLAQLLQLPKADDDHIPEEVDLAGRAAGSLRVTVPINDWFAGSGQGELRLSESDLVRLPLFSSLYDVMNLRVRGAAPQGHGDARFRIEGRRFVLSNLAYEERGANIRVTLEVSDLEQGPASPITGRAMATVNPLPILPWIQEYIDALLDYKGDITTVEIGGTIQEQSIRPIPFSLFRELGAAVLPRSAPEEDQSPEADPSPESVPPPESVPEFD
ncbi:MAG: hypothetical protein JJU36_10470, partial [Phycisphaeraceae bacterium]|nr:hypothetical protein [Phycisphaeraceae bacterium]